MSATLRGYPAIPTFQDQSPWQQALAATPGANGGATQQHLANLGSVLADTGGAQGGESAQGPWSDNTPVQGGGTGVRYGGPPRWEDGPGSAFTGSQGGNTFGTTYADPGGGWDPWSLYDGRRGYDGTAIDGHYNAQADTKKGWGPNGTPETDRDRVWRMTLADLGPNPGGQSPERVKAAFLNNVARLKRDYMDTPGMGAQAWAGSAFSGYDKFAQGGTGQQGGQQGQQPQGSVAIDGGGQPAQGGTAMNPVDPRGQGYHGANAGDPGRPRPGLPQAPPGGAAYTSNNGYQGGTVSQPGQFGQFHTDDIANLIQKIQGNPQNAATIWRAMKGQSGPLLGRMAQDRSSLYGQALVTLLGLSGLKGMPNASDTLSNFATQTQSPGGLLGMGGDLGQMLGGMDLSGFTSEELDALLSGVATMKGMNMGKIARSNMGTQLDTLQQQDFLHSAQDSNNDLHNYSGDLASTNYGRHLMAYLANR